MEAECSEIMVVVVVEEEEEGGDYEKWKQIAVR